MSMLGSVIQNTPREYGQTASRMLPIHPCLVTFYPTLGSFGLSTNSVTLLAGCDFVQFIFPVETSSGTARKLEKDALDIRDKRTSGTAINELRHLSGLTWDQLAKVLDVTRRALHHWANGKPMNVLNEARLYRVSAFVQKTDRGDAQLNRAALLSVREEDGVSVLDLLRKQEYAEAEAIVGRGVGRAKRILKPLSKEARLAKEPSRVADLLEARPDISHKRRGRLVRELSRPVKRPK